MRSLTLKALIDLSQNIAMRWRLGAVLLVFTLSLILIGSVGALTIQSLNRMVIKLTSETIHSMELIASLEKTLKSCQIGLLELTLPGIADAEIEKTYNQTKTELQNFDGLLKKLKDLNLGAAEQEQIQSVERSWIEFQNDSRH